MDRQTFYVVFLIYLSVIYLYWVNKVGWSKEKDDIKGSGLLNWMIPFALLAIGFVILPYLSNFIWYDLSNDPAVWGQFGDFFGGVLNPIMSLLSFVALLYTIRIQIFELKETTKEMKNGVEAQKDMLRHQKEMSINEDLNKRLQLVDESIKSLLLLNGSNKSAKDNFLESVDRSLHPHKKIDNYINFANKQYPIYRFINELTFSMDLIDKNISEEGEYIRYISEVGLERLKSLLVNDVAVILFVACHGQYVNFNQYDQKKAFSYINKYGLLENLIFNNSGYVYRIRNVKWTAYSVNSFGVHGYKVELILNKKRIFSRAKYRKKNNERHLRRYINKIY